MGPLSTARESSKDTWIRGGTRPRPWKRCSCWSKPPPPTSTTNPGDLWEERPPADAILTAPGSGIRNASVRKFTGGSGTWPSTSAGPSERTLSARLPGGGRRNSGWSKTGWSPWSSLKKVLPHFWLILSHN